MEPTVVQFVSEPLTLKDVGIGAMFMGLAVAGAIAAVYAIDAYGDWREEKRLKEKRKKEKKRMKKLHKKAIQTNHRNEPRVAMLRELIVQFIKGAVRNSKPYRNCLSLNVLPTPDYDKLMYWVWGDEE